MVWERPTDGETTEDLCDVLTGRDREDRTHFAQVATVPGADECPG